MFEITESRAFVEAAKPSTHEGTGRIRIALLTPGWGSSGYYSTDVCEAAGTDRVFAAGTHMYINHPTATENYERPVRDLTQLAAVLAEDATWNSETSQLEADAITFSTWREPISEMAEHIGVSIRAGAEVEENGSAEGKDGRIITRITEGLSVDFVTKAGRGGKVLEVVEDAFGAGRAAAQGVVHEALQSELERSLRQAVRATYSVMSTESSPGVYAWMRDYDPATGYVYYDVETSESSKVYREKFTEGSGSVALEGSPEEVRVAMSYVPVAAPSGQSTSTQESQEGTMAQIEEARLRALEEAETRVAALEKERNDAVTESATAKEALARANAISAANTIVESVFTGLHIEGYPTTKSLVAEKFTLKEDGTLDEDALRKRASEAAAEIAESAGQGKVRGLGGTGDNSDDLSDEALEAELAKFSGRTIVKEA